MRRGFAARAMRRALAWLKAGRLPEPAGSVNAVPVIGATAADTEPRGPRPCPRTGSTEVPRRTDGGIARQAPTTPAVAMRRAHARSATRALRGVHRCGGSAAAHRGVSGRSLARGGTGVAAAGDGAGAVPSAVQADPAPVRPGPQSAPWPCPWRSRSRHSARPLLTAGVRPGPPARTMDSNTRTSRSRRPSMDGTPITGRYDSAVALGDASPPGRRNVLTARDPAWRPRPGAARPWPGTTGPARRPLRPRPRRVAGPGAPGRVLADAPAYRA